MSDSLQAIKKKARMLQRAFPEHFTLSQAQEATAKLLGYMDWYALSRACQMKHNVLPTTLIRPTDPAYRPCVYQFVKRLADDYGVPALLAHRFFMGWGVFAPVLSRPFEYSYFEMKRDLSNQSQESTRDAQDDLYEDDFEIREIVEGIITAGPDPKYHYWHLSPERHRALPPALQGGGTVFLEGEGRAFVVLAFKREFSQQAIERAVQYLSQWEPALLEWLFPEFAHRNQHSDFSVKSLLEQAKKHVHEWIPLSYRLSALPYNPKNPMALPSGVVAPALKGDNFATFIESQGALKLADVRWFERIPHLSLPYQNPMPFSDMKECEPHYAYPFKHGPMHRVEYSPHSEGGDLGLGFYQEPEDGAAHE